MRDVCAWPWTMMVPSPAKPPSWHSPGTILTRGVCPRPALVQVVGAAHGSALALFEAQVDLIAAADPTADPAVSGSAVDGALETYTERLADPAHRAGLETLRHSLWRVIASMLNDRPQKCGLCRLVPPRAVCLPWLGRGWGEVGARLVRDCAPAPPCAAFNSDYSEH